MAWARFRCEDELYRLTDGYVQRVAGEDDQGSEEADLEGRMAQKIYRLAERRCRRGERPANRQRGPPDVWVLGKPGWPGSGVAEPVRSILEGERDAAYRIIVSREGRGGNGRKHVLDWSGYIYAAGMTRKKRHANVASFKSAAETLLSLMHDYDQDTSTSIASLLEALNVPFAHAGRSDARRDGTPLRWIQQ